MKSQNATGERNCETFWEPFASCSEGCVTATDLCVKCIPPQVESVMRDEETTERGGSKRNGGRGSGRDALLVGTGGKQGKFQSFCLNQWQIPSHEGAPVMLFAHRAAVPMPNLRKVSLSRPTACRCTTKRACCISRTIGFTSLLNRAHGPCWLLKWNDLKSMSCLIAFMYLNPLYVCPFISEFSMEWAVLRASHPYCPMDWLSDQFWAPFHQWLVFPQAAVNACIIKLFTVPSHDFIPKSHKSNCDPNPLGVSIADPSSSMWDFCPPYPPLDAMLANTAIKITKIHDHIRKNANHVS